MVKKQHRAISIVLCLLLALSALFVGTFGASAASGDTVYVKLNNGWSKVYAYMWKDGGSENAKWPGVEMTKVEGDVYSYTLSGDYDKIIFTNGGNGVNQTDTIVYAGNGKIYDLKAKTWSTYVEAPTSATTATTATTATKATQPTPGDGVTVFLNNEAGWSTPHCYMWTDGASNNAAFPGVEMTLIGDNIYQYSADADFAKCIFNAGNDKTKTLDLKTMNGYIYNNKTNEWSVYDLSPLQVKSVSADPASGVYIGADVTLSALAQNKDGAAVTYKFSVTNAAGATSVLADYGTANSVVWTPTAAGTYTVNFDFKDSDGNENNRTLTIEVADDSMLIKPLIKSVTPAMASLIKVNTPATVSVKAGGGKTGTNLLFYKYVVVDPNGVQNIPYYTLNSTYSFTPTMAGKYTVNVFVQNSDNSTVNKKYEYTATSGEIPTNPTVPTTIKPTAAPTVPTTVKPTVAPTVPTTVKPTVAPTVPTTAPVVIKGDANGDGIVTVEDATYIQKFRVDIPGYFVSIAVGDVNNDGVVDVKDATAIQSMIAFGTI